ncbi:hypothetical protein PV325_013141 [Microctonus aethiopoides]|nr:hypothetical protein PV325_013141 [Microctonus aethiopoides]
MRDKMQEGHTIVVDYVKTLENARYEQSQNVGENTNDRRKLLKRTRSLAVITEDTARSDRNTREDFHFGETPNFSIPRRPQLIPRAKLIDRHSLKDRLSRSQQHLYDPEDRIEDERSYHSRSTCDIYGVAPPLPYFHEITTPSCSRGENRIVEDRLNILDWPRTPRRYRSHQDLDTVSGLVDIVEDNCPIDDPQSCNPYTQVKRKRKEHRSLDSILFEDERELEYFDVLNLLPLSKVRLELDEADTRSHQNLIAAKQIQELSTPITSTNFKVPTLCDDFDVESIEESERRHTPRILQVSEFSDDNQDDSLHLGSNITDEEKCKSHSITEGIDTTQGKNHSEEESCNSLITLSCRGAWGIDSHRESLKITEEKSEALDEREKIKNDAVKKEETQERVNNFVDKTSEIPFVSDIGDDSVEKNSCENGVIVAVRHDTFPTVGESEDFKAIWVTDTDENMTRRPQVLKIVDNDVTRRQRHNVNAVEVDTTAARDVEVYENHDDIKANKISCVAPLNTSSNIPHKMEEKIEELNHPVEQKRLSIENARNIFEGKREETENSRNQRNEGRFERIVKETTNIIEKACNAVKGSLGFEARSESSDLGLGSDCGSDTRRRSFDDNVDIIDDTMCQDVRKNSKNHLNGNHLKVGRTNLTRSHSCVDSLECQPDNDGVEFDHIRYKIVKSKLFGKNLFANVSNKTEPDYDGIMEYLREYSIQELLLDNNVVIIEPVRAEPVDIKHTSAYNKGKFTSTYRVAGSVQKKEINKNDQTDDKLEINNSTKISKQSTLRKHFFYHPIRVNRELIDEELPDPDTVKNVRQMFETTFRPNSISNQNNSQAQKSISMKDLSCITECQLDAGNERSPKVSRSRCFSRAKDLTRLFENLDKTSSRNIRTGKEDNVCCRSNSKTRILAQSFEARSGNTSPCDSGCARNKIIRYRHQNHRQRQKHTSWDAGSVSSGVSSDYPDTDGGSGAQCTSSEDEDVDCRDEEEMRNSERVHGHFVSQDVLRKIRECGTSVTYYGGKVVNTCNGPLISPMTCKINRNERLMGGDGGDNGDGGGIDGDDYVKFRLVKSNSCDSRLELAGRVIERRSRLEARELAANIESTRKPDLRTCTIAETPSIEITSLDNLRVEEDRMQPEYNEGVNINREPPVVIGLEPKKDENRHPITFKADFKLGKINDTKSNITNRFGSALMRWQINETNWNKKQTDFGKMEFEEFEVLEDSLNGPENC